MRRLKPKDPESLEPRGYAFSQNVRNRHNHFGQFRSNNYRYGKNDGISTVGFNTIDDCEANEDTVKLASTAQPIAGDKSAPRLAPNFPSNSINVVSQVEQTSHLKEERV